MNEAFEISFQVLGYREDDEWIALALEMDLRGYGATFEEAMGELEGLVDAQVTFALQQRRPEMIWKNAEPQWFTLFLDARRRRVANLLGAAPIQPDYIAADVSVPPGHVIQALEEGGFSRAES